MPYNAQWPQDFRIEASNLRALLGDEVVAIHHIGSTAVPGLAAKQDIDMILVVKHLDAARCLQDSGYLFKGEINIPLRTFFSKNSPERKINLHVCEKNHNFISLNLCFRDWLRQHDEDRIAYQTLKQTLVKNPDSHIKIGTRLVNYSLQKNAFIKKILEKAGHTDAMVNFCLHHEEWIFAQKMRQQYQLPTLADAQQLNALENKSHHHFIVYEHASMMAYAHVERLSSQHALLHGVWTPSLMTQAQYVTKLLQTLEPWLCRQGIHRLEATTTQHTQAALIACGFAPIDHCNAVHDQDASSCSNKIMQMFKCIRPT